MSIVLGTGFPVVPVQREEPGPDPTDLRLNMVLVALESLRDSLTSLPAPQVTIDAPDLSAIVNAVNGLRPGVVDPREIGEAVANALVPMRPEASDPVWQDRLIAALDKLDFRMKGIGSGGGGPASLPPSMSVAPIADTGQTALPVRIISQLGAGTGGGSTGGLTDTELRATPVPVSGTVSVSNFPATQPVSIASTVPVTGTFWQATQPVSLATNTPDVIDRAGRILGHVTVDSAPTTAVTGTFWPATQPISAVALPLPAGAAQDGTDISSPTAMPAGGAGIRGWLSAIWTKLNGSLAVTGTFWQTTQPVSLATNTPDVIDRAGRLLGVVSQSAITKGTQGTVGVTTQDLKDAGRTAVILSAVAVTSIVTETVISLNQHRAGASSTVTSYTVPAGKTFRLQSVQFGVRFTTNSTTVTFGNARFNLRLGALVTSPLIFGDSKMAAANVPTPNSDLAVPDGLEFAAGTVLSLWQASSAITMSLDALIVGYEY